MFISYLTAPKAVTSHRGWSQLSTKWWWPPLRRLPNIQPYHWVPTSPLTNDVHVENLDINFDQSRNPDFFFKKNRQDLIGAKDTPGCVFLFFFKRKRWHSAMVVRGGRNAKVYTLRCGCKKITQWWKSEQVCCCCCFLSFPVSFAVVVVVFEGKVVLFFFACCWLLSFWLCLFARFEAFASPIMLLCLRLLIARIISCPSPFSSVYFLSFNIFFTTFNLFASFAALLLCFLLCCFGRADGFFSCLVRLFRRPKLNNVLIRCPIFFAVPLMRFLMSSGPYLLCCFFCCCCPPWPCVSEYAPRDLVCPPTPNFPCPLWHITPIRPKQPMCDHLHLLCARTYGYDCARVCLRFCVFVACTARVWMPVFGLAGAYMLVFCAF